MAYYLVKAKYHNNLLAELRKRLDSGEIQKMRPFGQALHYGLDQARLDPEQNGFAIWEEEDYCRPPLAQERAAVLDTYFTDLQVEVVEEGKGWDRIQSLPKLWMGQKDFIGGGQHAI
ncbi:MAG: hypothetical protein JNK32_04875 [Anaerolineales bacterium]|nr:hypothetical protein [Anaerolineales bacterium]